MSFQSKYKMKDSLNILRDLAIRWLRNEHDIRAIRLRDLLIARDWKAVIEFDIEYAQPDNVELLVLLRQVLGLFTKNPCVPLEVDTQYVAWCKFLECEELCKAFNDRYRVCSESGENFYSPEYNAVFHRARMIISDILGPVPCWSDLKCSFGPGSNTSVNKASANSRVKLSCAMGYSRGTRSILGTLFKQFPLLGRFEDSYTFLSPGQLSFVPKNAKTDRTIVVPPLLTGFVQKGVGAYMKDRLLRHGIKMKDQEYNQTLACKGSVTGSLATVDFSSASDLVSYALVLDLLPFGWFCLLDSCRVDEISFKNPWSGCETQVLPEKFSGMGDAFTFELESLIFFALARATCDVFGYSDEVVSVFGDDVILPSACYSHFREVATQCGFQLNTDKSYSAGPFRESCGADWYLGFDLRPVYIKDQISLSLLFILHNGLYRKFEFEKAKDVLGLIPDDFRIFGPDGYGDGHLLGDWNPISKRSLTRSGFEGSFFDTYLTTGRFLRKKLPGDWIYPTYSVYVSYDGTDSEEESHWRTLTGSTEPSDPDRLPGFSSYQRVSIYTLQTRVLATSGNLVRRCSCRRERRYS